MPFDYNVSHHSCFTMCIFLDGFFCPILTWVFHNYPRGRMVVHTCAISPASTEGTIISGICTKTTSPDFILCLGAGTWQLLCPFLINTPWLSLICIFSNTHSRSQGHLNRRNSVSSSPPILLHVRPLLMHHQICRIVYREHVSEYINDKAWDVKGIQ